MKRPRQPDLFDAQLLVFPIRRWDRQVREAAEKIVFSDDDTGAEYWAQLVAGIHRELRAIGIPALTIDRELYRFRERVQAEVFRLEDQHFGGRLA